MISYPNSILASHTNDPTSLYANATPSSCSIATNHSSSLPRKHSKMSLTFLNNPTSAHFNHHVDTFASPSSSPQTDHSDPIQSVIYTSPATFSDHAAIHESQSSADCDSEDDPDNSPNFKARKRAFIKSLTEQRADKGYLTCKLCMQSIWGPNGRYHIETCPVLIRLRSKQNENLILSSVNGIRIYHEFFERPKPLKPKRAKIHGFVMSNTVLLDDPFKAPTREQLKAGARVGRKGYTRCLRCNTEQHAPNTKRHLSLCRGKLRSGCR